MKLLRLSSRRTRIPFNIKGYYARKLARKVIKEGYIEDVVEAVLKKMVAENKILNFMRHRYREERSQGKDFTFVVKFGRSRINIPFGVTMCHYNWRLSALSYPDVIQFCWPIGTDPLTIEDRLGALIRQEKEKISNSRQVRPKAAKVLMCRTA